MKCGDRHESLTFARILDNFADAGVLFTSAWKLNPQTGDVYIAGTKHKEGSIKF